MNPLRWGDKPYHSLDYELKHQYGEKIYKIALDARYDLSQPGRHAWDTRWLHLLQLPAAAGTLQVLLPSACGEYSMDASSLLEGHGQIPREKETGQSTSSPTFRPTPTPMPLTGRAAQPSIPFGPGSHPEVVRHLHCHQAGLSGAGCTGSASSLKDEYPDKFLWVELGLQTIHEETAHYIRRGYPLSPASKKACTDLTTLRFPVIVHTILGLPREIERQVLETMKLSESVYCSLGIKLQLLHVLKDTDLADDYEQREYLRF